MVRIAVFCSFAGEIICISVHGLSICQDFEYSNLGDDDFRMMCQLDLHKQEGSAEYNAFQEMPTTWEDGYEANDADPEYEHVPAAKQEPEAVHGVKDSDLTEKETDPEGGPVKSEDEADEKNAKDAHADDDEVEVKKEKKRRRRTHRSRRDSRSPSWTPSQYRRTG